MEFHGTPQNFLEFHGLLWNSMEAPCISTWAPWNYIGSMDTPWSSMEFHGLVWSSLELSWNFHGSSMEYLWTLHGSLNYWVSWNVTQLFNEHQKVSYQHKLFKEGQFNFMCQGIYWEDSFLKTCDQLNRQKYISLLCNPNHSGWV